LNRYLELENSTIEIIKSNFTLPDIGNLNNYFKELYDERNECIWD
ncbi:MAG: hypothetical protein RLZZ546_1767, partial [Bacteroidota bacterium]